VLWLLLFVVVVVVFVYDVFIVASASAAAAAAAAAAQAAAAAVVVGTQVIDQLSLESKHGQLRRLQRHSCPAQPILCFKFRY
jgi:tryptophan synthase alpha subunit